LPFTNGEAEAQKLDDLSRLCGKSAAEPRLEVTFLLINNPTVFPCSRLPWLDEKERAETLVWRKQGTEAPYGWLSDGQKELRAPRRGIW